MAKKIGLGLGGGTALGTAHLGVLQCLQEHSIPIDCIAGTSAGSLVAACFAFGVSVEDMKSKAEGLSWRAIAQFSLSKQGFASNEALAEIVKAMIGDPQIEDAKIPLAIVATNIATGEKVVFRKGSVLSAVRASTCLPGVFAPVQIDTEYYVDGGLKENVPISPLVSMGADIRIGVNVTRWLSNRMPTNVFDVLDKSFAIMLRRTVPPIENEIAIEPHLDGYLSSDFTKTSELFTHGYEATSLRIPEIKNMIRAYPGSKFFKRFRSWTGK